jgi:hypothetical protein
MDVQSASVEWRRGRAEPRPRTEVTTKAAESLRTRETLTRESATALQRLAGNSAVVSLIRGDSRPQPRRRPKVLQLKAIQRDEIDKPKDDDPKGYTKPGGVRDVENTGMTRVEVRGLKYGVTGGHQKEYQNWRGGVVPSFENQMTKESPDNTAVVIRPDVLNPKCPTQVILHFHGWGFRDVDPFAGYLVATGQRSGQGAHGQVRDVDQEHWEQQRGAVGKERAVKPNDPSSMAGPQIVAVLAQGRGMSDFGNVPTFDYIADVFAKAGGELAQITNYHIILSAHSGGGNMQVAKKTGDAVGTDPARLRTGTKDKADQQPSDLVILFDAEGSASLASWVVGEIGRLTAAIKADPAKAQDAILKAPKFRGYFATGGAYWRAFHDACTTINAALRGVPADWRRPDTANPGSVKVSDLFRIIEVSDAGVNHEHVISRGTKGKPEVGALADALRASLDPTIDRAAEYDPVEGAPRLAKFEELAAKRAKAAKEAAAKKEAEKAAKQAAAKKPAVQPSLVPGALPVV